MARSDHKLTGAEVRAMARFQNGPQNGTGGRINPLHMVQVAARAHCGVPRPGPDQLTKLWAVP
jgi:hypothetical protein